MNRTVDAAAGRRKISVQNEALQRCIGEAGVYACPSTGHGESYVPHVESGVIGPFLAGHGEMFGLAS